MDTSVVAGTRVPPMGGDWALSIVTEGELRAGVLLATDAETRAHRLRQLTTILDGGPVLPIDPHVAARYAELRAASGRQPANDLWIAATALANDLTLVTADRRMAALPLVRTQLVP